MRTRLCLFGLLVWIAALPADAEVLKCELCGSVIHGKYYELDDRAVGGKKNYCHECGSLDDRCFACGLPVKPQAKRLADGRFLCARDADEAVKSDAEAREICEQVHQDLDRQFSRFLTLPGDNVDVSIVDRFQLESLFKSPGYERSCVSIFGATRTQPLPHDRFVHSISILSNLRKGRLMAVCAHEYTHAWMGQNLKPERKAALAPDAVEGICELMAYKYMEARHEEWEVQVIRTSDYTKGQIAALLEAESRYGFNTVLEWVKSGEDSHLTLDNLDRVRAVQTGGSLAASPVPALYLPPAPAPAATTLMLKGISGTPTRRFALINDGTFEVMEKGRVRLGATNVTIRCLEIRNDSVVVQKDGSAEKQELFIGQR